MKDPAFLFYPGDWLGGTMGMSFKEKGAYMELLVFQFNRGPFTEKQALTFLKDEKIWKTLKSKFSESDGLFKNDRLEVEKQKRKNYTESRRQSRLKSDEDSVRIYIVRDNVRSTYKIGSSVNPLRRYNELANQQNPAIMQSDWGDRDLTLVWYSEVIPRSEEKKLHKKFKSKHIKGEWFDLNDDDLQSIFNQFEGTYVERTNERTENEDENEDINKSQSGKEGTGEKPTPEIPTFEIFLQHAKTSGKPIDENKAKAMYEKWKSAGWNDSKGNPIHNWKALLNFNIPDLKPNGRKNQQNNAGFRTNR